MCGKISAVDLFCGVGGLTCGLRKSGIKVRCGIDIDSACEFPYTYNNPKSKFIKKSVTELSSLEIANYLDQDNFSLLAGCAPCQTFSKYNPKASRDDVRWNLLHNFGLLVKELSPDYVTMENVPQLRKFPIFDNFVSLLKEKYYIWYGIVHCEEYGLPQHRCRLVLLASKWDKISLLSPEEFGSTPQDVRSALGKMPPIQAGEIFPEDRLHTSPALTPKNLERIRYSKPGGTWRDWPEELRVSCHRKQSGQTYASVYGRMQWEKPSPTLTTQFYGYGNGRFGHPEQDRAISLREGAILQGFPLNYEFVPPNQPVITKTVGRMIGNAVPVILGEVIGKSIIAHCKRIQK